MFLLFFVVLFVVVPFACGFVLDFYFMLHINFLVLLSFSSYAISRCEREIWLLYLSVFLPSCGFCVLRALPCGTMP